MMHIGFIVCIMGIFPVVVPAELELEDHLEAYQQSGVFSGVDLALKFLLALLPAKL